MGGTTSFGATSQASRRGAQNTRVSAPDGVNGRDSCRAGARASRRRWSTRCTATCCCLGCAPGCVEARYSPCAGIGRASKPACSGSRISGSSDRCSMRPMPALNCSSDVVMLLACAGDTTSKPRAEAGVRCGVGDGDGEDGEHRVGAVRSKPNSLWVPGSNRRHRIGNLT